MYLIKRNKIYYLCVSNNKRLSTKTTNKKLALKILKKYKPLSLPEEKKSITLNWENFSNEITDFLITNNFCDSTICIYKNVIKNLKLLFPNPENINPEIYKSVRLEKVKPITINIELKTMKAIYNKAIYLNLLKNNPVKNVPNIICKQTHNKVFSSEQINLIIQKSEGLFKDCILFTLNTGLRKGELINLRWIDVSEDEIIIKNSINYRVKSDRVRIIKLNDISKKIINKQEKYCEFVFGYIKSDFLSRKLKRLCERLEIPYLHWHNLRHTFITHLINSGCNIFDVMRIAGHSQISTTMQYYRQKDIIPPEFFPVILYQA